MSGRPAGRRCEAVDGPGRSTSVHSPLLLPRPPPPPSRLPPPNRGAAVCVRPGQLDDARPWKARDAPRACVPLFLSSFLVLLLSSSLLPLIGSFDAAGCMGIARWCLRPLLADPWMHYQPGLALVSRCRAASRVPGASVPALTYYILSWRVCAPNILWHSRAVAVSQPSSAYAS